jgi:hypothetical protein
VPRSRRDVRPFTPWRKIQFVEGELAEPPAAPVYRIQRGFERLDPPDSRGWVKLLLPASAHFLEGPINVTVEGYQLRRNAITLTGRQIDGEGETARVVPLDFKRGEASWEFNPPRPGRYRFETDVPFSPQQADVVVAVGATYLWVFLGALAGAVFAIYAAREVGTAVPVYASPPGGRRNGPRGYHILSRRPSRVASGSVVRRESSDKRAARWFRRRLVGARGSDPVHPSDPSADGGCRCAGESNDEGDRTAPTLHAFTP